MPRLQTDLVALFAAMDNGTLEDANISFDPRAAATIMAVSGGYPGDYEKGKPIHLPEPAGIGKDQFIFHAGTQQRGENIITAGGRVLTVTSFGETISAATSRSLELLNSIDFEGINFRRDIGYEFE